MFALQLKAHLCWISASFSGCHSRTDVVWHSLVWLLVSNRTNLQSCPTRWGDTDNSYFSTLDTRRTFLMRFKAQRVNINTSQLSLVFIEPQQETILTARMTALAHLQYQILYQQFSGRVCRKEFWLECIIQRHPAHTQYVFCFLQYILDDILTFDCFYGLRKTCKVFNSDSIQFCSICKSQQRSILGSLLYKVQ